MTRRVVGPFNRVEGDLEVRLEIDRDRVEAAWINSPLYRGFEQILLGKDPSDALVYTPRICGICSVSQSMAAATALAALQGIEPPPNGLLVHNLILAAENVADHLTHFYMFFMPDFAREVYAAEPWFADVERRFRAIKGDAARQMLPARAQFMHLLGLLAGRWPHTLALQPGGATKAVEAADQARILATLAAFRRYLETTLYAAPLEAIAGLATPQALDAYAAAGPPASADMRQFLMLSSALGLARLGPGPGRYMSFGAYALPDATHAFARGVVDDNGARPLDPAHITEDHASAWLAASEAPLHPERGMTLPAPQAPGGYTWCKAPRLAGEIVEVGALARQVVDRQPLLVALVARDGANVANRIVARLVEIARIVVAMEQWAMALRPREAFCLHAEQPAEGRAAGLVEAARGSLGHWLEVKQGRIRNYQIIAPTTWNFSPRDASGVPGACEQALVGAPVREGERDPVAVQHIVRSFDPCMVCTVH